MSKGRLASVTVAVVMIIGAITYYKLNSEKGGQSDLSLDNFKTSEPTGQKLEPASEPHPFDMDNDSPSVVEPSKTESPKVASKGQGDEDDNQSIENGIDKDFQEQINNALETQINADYKDFFASLGLDEEAQKKLSSHYMENKKKQQELIMMLMDENLSLEEIMDKQEMMANSQNKNLEKLLNEDQLSALEDFNKKLPEKNLGKQIDSLLGDIGASDQELNSIKNIIISEEKKDYDDGRSLTLIQSKHSLDFDSEHFKSLRDIMLSSQKGDPSAIERNLKYELERNKRINEQVPAKYRKAIQEKQEESLNIQRSVVKMLKNKDS